MSISIEEITGGFIKEPIIPKPYKQEFELELMQVNIKREQVLAVALIGLAITLLTVDVLSYRNPEVSLYVSTNSIRLHIALLLAAVAFLSITRIYRHAYLEKYEILKSAHIFISSVVLLLCAIIGVNNELVNQRPFSYLTAMFCISAAVLISRWERAFIFILPWSVYQIGLMAEVKELAVVLQNFVFVTLLTVLSMIISGINYSAYLRNFMNRKIIQKNNEELGRLYKLTETRLEKQTEELYHTKEMEKMRTAFFANISHELRTPLNVIFSAEQMLDRTLKELQLQMKQKEIDQYMRIMRQNCYRLIRLIANLIDITKIDAGYLQLSPRNCDIVRIVEDITLSVADYIEEKNISLTFDTEVEEKVIACDPDKIERIILNLLSNAIKFTPAGGQVLVNMYDRGDRIIISIKDTGIGIPEDMRDLIFERFVQVDKTSTRAREGSGIGLSLVKSLVEMHNGSVSVRSNLGEGSEFIVEIPAAFIAEEAFAEEAVAEGSDFTRENQNVDKISIEFSDIYD